MNFIEFEQTELIFRNELFDTVVFSNDELIMIGPKNYFNFKIKNLRVKSLVENSLIIELRQGLGFISKKEAIKIPEMPKDFLLAISLFNLQGGKEIFEKQ